MSMFAHGSIKSNIALYIFVPEPALSPLPLLARYSGHDGNVSLTLIDGDDCRLFVCAHAGPCVCACLNHGSKSICTQAVIIKPVSGCISPMLTRSSGVDGGEKEHPWLGGAVMATFMHVSGCACVYFCIQRTRVCDYTVCVYYVCVPVCIMCVDAHVSDSGDAVSSRDADPQIEPVNHCD